MLSNCAYRLLNFSLKFLLLLRVNSKHICKCKEWSVFEGVWGKSITWCVPEASAANLHALLAQLPNMYSHNNFVSWYHKIFYPGLNYLKEKENTCCHIQIPQAQSYCCTVLKIWYCMDFFSICKILYGSTVLFNPNDSSLRVNRTLLLVWLWILCLGFPIIFLYQKELLHLLIWLDLESNKLKGTFKTF